MVNIAIEFKRVFDSVHEVCRIPAGAGGIRHSVALAIKYYPVFLSQLYPTLTLPPWKCYSVHTSPI
jgi:hypothetical protein